MSTPQQQQQYIEQPTSPDTNLGQESIDAIFSPMGLMAIAGCLLFGLSYVTSFSKNKKGTLARGQLANNKHRTTARKKAIKLMSARVHNEVALYIGTPRGAEFHRVGKKWKVYLPEDPSTLYIPGTEAHTAVVGATGCGKSFSGISPMVRSAIDQGFPIIYFDLKYTADSPNPSSGFMGYAQDRGYDTNVFAPGLPESCRCNPLDLLRDEYDAETARQFAIVTHKNFTPSNAQGNPFFDQNAQQLIQGILMLAKKTQYPDLMTARAIGRLPGLVDLLTESDLPEVIKAVFDPLVSSAGAPETLSGIQATVAKLLGNLMTPNLLSALVGETTMPLDLDSRQFLTFGVDGQRRDVVLPLIASIMHLVVNRNIQRARKTPLILVLDEIPAIYLPALADWLNQARSAGLCCILGFQSIALLEKLYGKNGAEELVTGCTTQMVFQLNDKATAQNYSDLIGKQDIKYSQKSRSDGKSSNRTRSEQTSTTTILEINEITTFPQGKCIIFNRGFGTKDSARVPYVTKIVIPERDLISVKESQARWPDIQKKLINKAQHKVPNDNDFKIRNQVAKELFSSSGEGSTSAGGVDTQFIKNQKEMIINLESALDPDDKSVLEIDESEMIRQIKQKQANKF